MYLFSPFNGITVMLFIPYCTHIIYPLATISYKWVYLMGNLVLHNIWVLSTTKRVPILTYIKGYTKSTP